MRPIFAIFNWSFSFDTQGQLQAGLFISLLSVWLLVGVFSYLNYYTRRRYFSIWTVAWLVYALYLTLSYSLYWYYGSFTGEPWWTTMLKQWAIGTAAVFMLWGSLRFLGKTVRQVSLSLFLCFLYAWSFVANFPWPDGGFFRKSDRLAMQAPIFLLIGAASIVTVWGFFQYRRKRKYLGAGLLTFGFTFWGLFVAAYPFLEHYSNYMSTGFFSASVLQMFIAVNMIILVLEQIRHARERQAARQLNAKDREKAVLQNRIVLTEERYRHLFEQSSEPIVITSRDDLHIVGLNPAAARVLGIAPEEARRYSLVDWLSCPGTRPQDHPAAQSWFEAICRQRFLQVQRKDGTQINVEVAGSAIDFAGETAFQFYLREITELSRLELQLRRAEKLSGLGQMISGVVHELNNPLTVSGSLIELVLMDPGLSANARDRLKTAAAEARRAARLASNFLKLAREGGAEKEALELNGIVRNVLDLRRADFKHADVELALALEPELPFIIANQDQIQQVLVILVNNALQAMAGQKGPAKLRVTTRSNQGRVLLSVEDSGPGVPAHLRSRIFEPFFTTKPAGLGTGLGLSMAHTYALEHRGRIFYETSALGGARFAFELPCAKPPLGDSAARASAAGPEPSGVHAPAATRMPEPALVP